MKSRIDCFDNASARRTRSPDKLGTSRDEPVTRKMWGDVSNKVVLYPHFSLHSINYLSNDLKYIKMKRVCWIQMTDGDYFSWNALGSWSCQ